MGHGVVLVQGPPANVQLKNRIYLLEISSLDLFLAYFLRKLRE